MANPNPFVEIRADLTNVELELANIHERLRRRVSFLAQQTAAQNVVSVLSYQDAQRCAYGLFLFVRELAKRVQKILELSRNENPEMERKLEFELQALNKYITNQKREVQKKCGPYIDVLAALEGVVRECQSIVSEIRGGRTAQPTQPRSIARKRNEIQTSWQVFRASLPLYMARIVFALFAALALIAAYFILMKALTGTATIIREGVQGVREMNARAEGFVTNAWRVLTNAREEEGGRVGLVRHIPPEGMFRPDQTGVLGQVRGEFERQLWDGNRRGVPFQLAENPNGLYFSQTNSTSPILAFSPSIGFVDPNGRNALFSKQEHFFMMLAHRVSQTVFQPNSGDRCVKAVINGDLTGYEKTPQLSYAAYLVSSLRPVLEDLIRTNPNLTPDDKNSLTTHLGDELRKLRTNPPPDFDGYEHEDYEDLTLVIGYNRAENIETIKSAIEKYLFKYGFETLVLFHQNYWTVESIVQIIEVGDETQCPTYQPPSSEGLVSQLYKSLEDSRVVAVGAGAVTKYIAGGSTRDVLLAAVTAAYTNYAFPGAFSFSAPLTATAAGILGAIRSWR